MAELHDEKTKHEKVLDRSRGSNFPGTASCRLSESITFSAIEKMSGIADNDVISADTPFNKTNVVVQMNWESEVIDGFQRC